MLQPVDILKKFWGHASFRPNQEAIIQSILSKKDTLALLPTGGGKSVCFQVPTLMEEGICIVVSPLLALMHDQVNQLRAKGITAYALTSFMAWREMDLVLDNCIYGNVKFLYVSPERLANETFLTRLAKMKVNLIAVDEAHCISQWGYDFRPSYLQIASIRKVHPTSPLLALTASATPKVVADIQEKLEFKNCNVFTSGFIRPNIVYVVYKIDDKEGKLLDVCRKVKGSAIVYCGTRARTKEVSTFLNQNKISAVHYHAGLAPEARNKIQENWFKGRDRIMCATNAFGMGIDKPDVRFVIHMDVPSDLESYYQEAGRGGRDSQKSFAVLLYNDADIRSLDKKAAQHFPPIEFVREVYKSICNSLGIAIGAGQGTTHRFDLAAICKQNHLSLVESHHALKLLERAGYITVNDSVREPSKIHITASRQVIYNYQVANPVMDEFLKLLLRMYGGLFDQYVRIHEEDMLAKGKMTRKVLLEKLDTLVKHGIIDYQPKAEEPEINLVTARQMHERLSFDPQVYQLRKNIEIQRTRAMFSYLESTECRQVMLVRYFGEISPEPCGKCDTCLNKKKSGLTPEVYDRISSDLTSLLMNQNVRVEDLHTLLPAYSRDHLLQLTQWKLDQGDIILNNDLRLALP